MSKKFTNILKLIAALLVIAVVFWLAMYLAQIIISVIGLLVLVGVIAIISMYFIYIGHNHNPNQHKKIN